MAKKKKEKEQQTYSKGDQIVHTHYGVGEIINIEEKKLLGKSKKYFVVRTADSTFWLPVKKANNKRVRPVADPDKVEQVIEILKDQPEEMEDHHKSRKSRIRKVKTDQDIATTAELVRDLSYRQAMKKINATERKALDNLMTRLSSEWAASMDISAQKAREKINRILEQHYQEEE
jgi:CarD family transcriptional regulator